MKRRILAVVLIFMTVFVTSCSIRSKEDYYNDTNSEPSDGDSVTIEIECSQILENLDSLEKGLEEYIPEDGIILKETEFFIEENESVYSVLKRAARKNHIQLEVQGSEENALGSVYVEGINYLYEFSCGPQSGWRYAVNGEYGGVGCDSYKLSNGDKIEWVYTCELEDFGQ